MARNDLPSIELLRQLLRYEPQRARLFWLERSAELMCDQANADTFNTRFAGREALSSVRYDGYKYGTLQRRTVTAHRVAFALIYGHWPTADVDHINGDKADNRACNLRAATRQQNLRNRRARKTSTSSYMGVCLPSQRSKWIAQIKIGDRNVSLGAFTSEEEAALAYDKAAAIHHGEFARLNFPAS